MKAWEFSSTLQAVMLLYGLLQLFCKLTYFIQRQLREMLVEYWTVLRFDNRISLKSIWHEHSFLTVKKALFENPKIEN